MKCRKCGSGNMGVIPNKKNPSATDLYCLDCGAWQKFATKDEIRLYQCKKGPITNADRIRAMSDEELASFMMYPVCKYTGCKGDCTEKNIGVAGCCKNILNWLQQPAKEE